ncbi:hypothetical protein RM550_34645 [Streptomyces sp. DSM 41527]|uniref:Secreted protein n=1 Tax=Streptomyces mooreae TaxID=3075523 RepID=A0ABU2TIQ6_9ACTN|nr:hypothetical protein [Streptomyces sp. DSM 41527]MDT0460802.1 hypothetical protein [Streptomyces sp. DSM 41527]
MRTISLLRWVNGLRALTPGLTVTAPVSARSGTALTTPAPGRALTTPAPGRAHAAPALHGRAKSRNVPARKGNPPVCDTAPTAARGTVPPSASGTSGRAAGPLGDLRLRIRPAVPRAAAVRCGAPHTAAGPAGASLPGFRHEAQPAL